MSEVSRNQDMLPLASAALGRALTCSLLMAEGLKQEESFQVSFNGDGPLNGVLATANGRLEAKGYVGNPKVTLAPNAMGKLDVGGGVGKVTQLGNQVQYFHIHLLLSTSFYLCSYS